MVGFALLLVLFGLGIGTAQQLKIAALPLRTTGTVVDVVSVETEDGTSRQPVIEFLTAKEERVRFTGHADIPKHAIGEKVLVAYDPDRLGEATIDGVADVWLMPLITAGMGLAIILLLVVVRRLRPAA